jgi:ATP-dependent 26S proteasome regulatory subunit
LSVLDPWLPIGFDMPGNVCCQRLRASGEDWQIFEADTGGGILVVTQELGGHWLDNGLLGSDRLTPVKVAGRELLVLNSSSQYKLATVYDQKAPNTKSDALAFAAALSSTRAIDAVTPLHDAIYIEELSRLLPTFTITPASSDDFVLGSWLTGGVQVSTNSRRRLQTFLSWMGRDDVDDILLRAGMDVAGVSGSAVMKSVSDSEDDFTAQNAQTESSVPERPSRKTTARQSDVFHLPGRPDLERLFNEHIIEIIRDPERYEAFGVGFPTAMALHGPPGCGKTFAVEKLVEYLDWPIFTIDSNSIGSPYIHGTSKKVAEIFDKALDAAPSAIVIDEMESYLTDREGGGQSGLHHVEEVAEFLRRIPEANENNVLVIGMTNRIEMIDPAILRRGRFDHIVEVGMPSAEEVASALTELLADMPKDDSIDVAALAMELAGRPMSDAAYVVREAGRNAAREGLKSLTQDCLARALELVPARTSEEKSKPIGFIWDE